MYGNIQILFLFLWGTNSNASFHYFFQLEWRGLVCKWFLQYPLRLISLPTVLTTTWCLFQFYCLKLSDLDFISVGCCLLCIFCGSKSEGSVVMDTVFFWHSPSFMWWIKIFVDRFGVLLCLPLHGHVKGTYFAVLCRPLGGIVKSDGVVSLGQHQQQ